MRRCAVCDAGLSEGTDWCPNQHYAGWGTDAAAVDHDQPADEGAVAFVAAPRVLVAFVGDAPERVVLRRGQSETLRVRVRNQSSIVQRFRLDVAGLPEDCWSASPSDFGLNPWGKPVPTECEIAVQLSPWQSATSVAAGEHHLRLRVLAESLSDGPEVEVGALSLVVELEPFVDVVAALVPVRRVGFRSGHFRINVTNRGTARSVIALDPVDANAELRFRPDEHAVDLGPEETATTDLRTRSRWRLVGAPRERAFHVQVTADAAPIGPAPLIGSFRHRSLFPWLTAALAAVVALGGIGAAIATSRSPMPPPVRVASTTTPVIVATPTATDTPAPIPTDTPTPTATAAPIATPTATPTPPPATSLHGTITWPDGTPVSGQTIGFQNNPDADFQIPADTDSRGRYTLSDIDMDLPISAFINISAVGVTTANGGNLCTLPLIPSYHDKGGSVWTITPRNAPHTDWTTGDRCLNEYTGGYSTWTYSENNPDPGTATWQDVKGNL